MDVSIGTIENQQPQAPETAPEKVYKKRGRKPNPNKKKDYFSETEEDLFRQYCTSDDEAFRNKVFNETLYPAFTKMVESIIRRYTLFTPGEEFQDTFNDVMSHLISKVEKFDVTKNKKGERVVELIPRVGEQIVYLGPLDDFESKLRRLRLFYSKAIDAVGWEKYARVNLEYDNQIICTKR